jgi:hypothetical protein
MAATEAACLILSVDQTVRNPQSEQNLNFSKLSSFVNVIVAIPNSFDRAPICQCQTRLHCPVSD